MDILSMTLFRDWMIFYQAGRAIRAGLSPYQVEGFFNPIQVAWLFSWTTWLPFQVWVYGMIGLSFILLVVLLKKQAHWALLSLPFIFGMSMGSLDVLLWVPARLLGGWGLSLLTLKPQLALLIAPLQLSAWWRSGQRKEIERFFIATLILWAIPTLLQPAWLPAWLRAVFTADQSVRIHWAASLAGFSALTGYESLYIALFFLVLLVFTLRGDDRYYLVAMFSPFFWPSDWILAAEYISWRFTLLSWLLVPTGLSPNGAQLYFLLGLLIAWEQHRRQKESPVPGIGSFQNPQD
ncbi:MAG: hypothetical protein WHS87_00355 [Anaerolineales bacterium]